MMRDTEGGRPVVAGKIANGLIITGGQGVERATALRVGAAVELTISLVPPWSLRNERKGTRLSPP